jgi:hypothetical protein
MDRCERDSDVNKKIKDISQQAEVALRVPGRLRPRIFSTFSTTRVVGRHPNAPAAFTPAETPGTHFQSLSQTQGTWFCRKEPRKKSQVTSLGIDSGTVRLVAQRFKHYATPNPSLVSILKVKCLLTLNCIIILEEREQMLWRLGRDFCRIRRIHLAWLQCSKTSTIYCIGYVALIFWSSKFAILTKSCAFLKSLPVISPWINLFVIVWFSVNCRTPAAIVLE